MNIYNTKPNNYVTPTSKPQKGLELVKQGSVTQITLGDKTFHVHDPARMEGIINLVERHEESLFELRQSNSVLRQTVNELTNTVRVLRNDVSRLQEQIKQYGTFL